MKRIALLSLPDPRFTVGDPSYEANRLDYRTTIETAIRVPLNRETGATIDEMRKGIRVLDALDASKDDVLALEDADWEFLKQKIEKYPWAYSDRRFVRFYDDVMQATEAPREPTRADGLATGAG
jgi:hypothetical protein